MSAPAYPAERAYRRRVLFAAEVLDGVTLARVTGAGVSVRAAALSAAPLRNASGLYVWLDTGEPMVPQLVTVHPGRLPYQGASAPAPLPPARLVQIVLPPARGYAFPAGATALRCALIESAAGAPVAAAGVELCLRWFDAGAWIDAAPRSLTDAHGEAVVALRLGGGDEPAKDAGGLLRVRLCARRAGAAVMSPEFGLAEGRVAERAAPFALNTFLP